MKKRLRNFIGSMYESIISESMNSESPDPELISGYQKQIRRLESFSDDEIFELGKVIIDDLRSIN